MTREHTGDTTPLPDEQYYQQPSPYAQTAPPTTQASSARRAGIALIVVGLLWLAFSLPWRGIPALGGGTSTLLDQTYPMQHIAMNVGNADVEVQSWDDNGIHVEAVQRGGGRDDYRVQASESGDTLQITSQQRSSWNWFSNRSLRYVVSIPAGARVQVETVSGDVQISGAERGVEVSTTSGDVKLMDVAGALNVTTISGDTELDDGQVQDATVQTTSGEINLQGIAGAVTLASTSGDVTLRDATPNQLNINVVSSDVDYNGDLVSGGQNKLESVSGDIQLHLPSASNFTLQASTLSGDLSLDDSFAAQRKDGSSKSLNATVGDGAATLNVQTVSGDVQIEAE